MPTITITDLNNGKKDVDFISEVATSELPEATDRLGRTKPTLAGAMSTLTAGVEQVNALIPGAVAQIDQTVASFQVGADQRLLGLGLRPSVIYAAGLDMTHADQSVEYQDALYSPKASALPFTTSSVFDPTKWWLVQNSHASQGNVAYVSVTGNDATAVIGSTQRAFRQVNAALTALSGVTGQVVVEILDGTSGLSYAPVKTDNQTGSLLRDFLTMRTAQRGWFNGVCTALAAVSIPGPFVVDSSLRKNFRWENLGCDSGKLVCDALYGGVAQDALVLANLPQTTDIVGMLVPVIDRYIGLCRDDDAEVHALLVEATSTAVVNDPVTCYGLHGGVVKSTLTTWRGGRHYRCNGEALIVKGDAYAKCDGGQYSELKLGGSPEGTTPWYAGTDLVGLKINPEGGPVKNQQFGPLAISDVQFGVRFQMSGPNAENISMPELSMTAVAIAGVLVDGPGTVVDLKIGTLRMSGCAGVAFAVGNSPMLRTRIAEISILNSGGAFDMSASAQDLGIDLVEVLSVIPGSSIYHLGSGRVRVGRERIHPASLPWKWHPADKPTYTAGWTTQASGATDPTVNLEGDGTALYGRANNGNGASGSTTILRMPLVLGPGTPDGSIRMTVRGQLAGGSGTPCDVGIVVGDGGGGICVVAIEHINGAAPNMATLVWVELTGIRWTY